MTGAVGALMLFLIALGYLNATGFCYRESRYLTNKQLISVAAIEAVKTNRAYAAIEQRIEYASATDLIARNPDCCIVIKDVGDQSADPSCGMLLPTGYLDHTCWRSR